VIVLDACVLIAHLDANDAHHRRATELLLEHPDEPLAISTLTLAEVLVGPTRAGKVEVVRLALGQLELETVSFTEDAPFRLAELRSEGRLRMPDCCVLLAARDCDASLATFDERLAVEASARGVPVLT